MTTIAYDGHTVVADSLATYSNIRSPTPVEKVRMYVVEDAEEEEQARYLVAGAGTWGADHGAFLQWLGGYSQEKGVGDMIDPGDTASTMMVFRLNPDGSHTAWHVTSNLGTMPITGQLWSIGSGGEYAEGYMQALHELQQRGLIDAETGTVAEQGAAAAVKKDVYSGLPLAVYDLRYHALEPPLPNAIIVTIP